MNNKRRVVVTGLGIISPVGNTVKSAWQNILAGKSGVRRIERFDPAPYAAQIAGEVRDFDATQYMDSKEARRMDPFIHYGIAACKHALEDSGLEITEENAHRAGISLGSGIGGLSTIQTSNDQLRTKGPRKISPFFIPATIINMAAGLASIYYGFKGPNISIVTACTTGTHSIGHAMRMIQYGDADIMLAGGAEMAVCDLGVAGFSVMRALSTRNDEPEKASRPWDRDRDGFVLSDGSGVLVLEEYEAAKKRGAKIYAEITGFGMSADATHMTAPNSDGGKRAMLSAIQDAAANPSDIQYINAHATSTPLGDIAEIEGIKSAFGDHAKQIAVSSTKSMTGHLIGAAGAVEAIFTILAMQDQVAPPTINLDNPSEGCDLNFVPNQPQEMKLTHCLSNSFGFGGTNGSLLFKKLNK